ncbi:hypothetical protein GX51_03691 [Blastomyces parvus]|uniref:Uncharacterized protein n=1 Tax=Blastomyces parvus TaxID=2060905 RepID=A0A2B7X5G2_9EURO|nr:hypothetical protein GX51_03691 [Blastomyces parvus]
MKTPTFSTLVLSLTFATGIVDALVARTIQERANTDPIGHGNYGNFENEIWRYQEVSDGLFVGVKPEEWNDSIHKRGVLPPEVHDLQSRATMMEEDNHLFERDLEGQCMIGYRCVHRAAKNTATWIVDAGHHFVNRVVQTHGPNFWESLQRPFMSTLVGIGIQNVVITGIFHGLENAGGAKQCSTAGTDADAVLAILKLLDSKDRNVNSVKFEITTPGGQKGIVSIALVEDGKNPPVLCGAPPA